MTVDRCANCKNYVGDLKCFAFPNGIPNSILTGRNIHNKPLKGQIIPIIFEQK